MSKKTKHRILVIHGPNLHLLGQREPGIYGKCTLAMINKELRRRALRHDLSIETLQSNAESDIVEKITTARYDLLIINPAAYTHTSVAIRDAMLAAQKPAIEVHLSNIYKREEFRKHSLISDVVMGTISGFNQWSYFLALEVAAAYLKEQKLF